MTAVFGLRTCALALCVAMAGRAQPLSDATQDPGALLTWNDTCELSVHGATVRWSVGDSGKLLKQIDGGTTAEYIVGKGQYDFGSVSFADASHGWIVGSKREDPERGRGVVFRTTTGGDGSQAWTASCPVIRPDINVPFLKVEALDVRHVWLTCGDGYMLYSNDGGARWAVAAKRSVVDESGTVGSEHEK